MEREWVEFLANFNEDKWWEVFLHNMRRNVDAGNPCMPLTIGEAKAKGLPTAGPFYESQPTKKEKS